MPWARALIGLGLLLALSGCRSTPQTHSRSWMERLRHLTGPVGPDVVYLDAAIVEKPVGHSYLDQDVWQVADEQVVPVDLRAALDENGFRVGQIGGLLPGALLTLIQSGDDPRHRTCRGGQPVTLALGSMCPEIRFRTRIDRSLQERHFIQAQCHLVVTPTPLPDGRIRLRFEPEIQHGERHSGALASAISALPGWSSAASDERFPESAWEVTLAANDWLIVGTQVQRNNTLGHACFVTVDPDRAVQRLLILRAGRTQPVADLESSPQPAGPAVVGRINSQSPPLALQAVSCTVRGQER